MSLLSLSPPLRRASSGGRAAVLRLASDRLYPRPPITHATMVSGRSCECFVLSGMVAALVGFSLAPALDNQHKADQPATMVIRRCTTDSKLRSNQPITSLSPGCYIGDDSLSRL